MLSRHNKRYNSASFADIKLQLGALIAQTHTQYILESEFLQMMQKLHILLF